MSVSGVSARVYGFIVLLCLLGIGPAFGAEKTGFWIALRSNMVIDKQVADDIGSRAGMIALRAAPEGPTAGYSYPEIVARLKRGAPGVPVLAYARVSRVEVPGRIEAYLFRDLDVGPLLAEVGKKEGSRRRRYLNVTDPAVRRAVVERLIRERKSLGVDGFAVDGALRTPVARPRALSQICDKKPGFCEVYAKSMDEILGTLNAALGEPGTLLYNGIWNSEPGMVEDQSRLLSQADAAAIEYFGMNPNAQRRGFSSEILPYLNILSRLARNKPVLFFGRGPWGYMDYAGDYRWQRYLYASFLLARRPEDLFKYHSSFQIPAHAGRAGGLDIYADWNTDLGSAVGPYRVEAGLYRRDFSRGLVIVAPDDGKGGQVRLPATYYTPEGQAMSEDIAVAPGQALILLNTQEQAHARTARRQIDARKIASWGWAQAELVKEPGGERLRLNPVAGGLAWEHDVWLDIERSLVPFERLQLDMVLLAPTSAALAVAEVDDPKGEHMRAVVVVGSALAAAKGASVRQAVQFRAHARENENWPHIWVEHKTDEKAPVVLDGPKVFGGSPYRFRRWSHLRLVGPLEISTIALDRRSLVPASVSAPHSAPQALRPELGRAIQSRKSH